MGPPHIRFNRITYSGTFVEFRNGMINVSPIGRNATYIRHVQRIPVKFADLQQQHRGAQCV